MGFSLKSCGRGRGIEHPADVYRSTSADDRNTSYTPDEQIRKGPMVDIHSPVTQVTIALVDRYIRVVTDADGNATVSERSIDGDAFDEIPAKQYLVEHFWHKMGQVR